MNNERGRILIVDDEPQITRVLRTSLSARGYDIRVAADGEGALQVIGDWPPDLIITDLAMPNLQGIELCRRVRAFSQAPIIVLSVRGEERAKIEALDAGADDFVTKPFHMGELLARIRAQLRRVPDKQALSVIEIGNFRMDIAAHELTLDGRNVHLTPKEFELLSFLAQRPNRVVTHRALLAAVWGPESTEQSEYLRVFIAQLRKKLETSGGRKYIATEPWVGYRFEPEDA